MPAAPHAAVPAGTEAPLVDHASLVLRAGRLGPVLPHMGWILRVSGHVPRDLLAAEAVRLARRPYGLGRRVRPRRIPGARRHWRVDPTPPPVALREGPLTPAAVRRWLDEELARPLDPERGDGWRLSAAHADDGDSVVLLVVHHLYGTVAGALRASAPHDDPAPWHGTTEARFVPGARFGLRHELDALGERLQLGLGGAARAARDALRRPPAPTPAPGPGPAPLRPAAGRDRTRRRPAPGRSAAILTCPADEWDAAAAARGGTGNTLLAALTANLVRRGRVARGGDVGRPVRLVLPIDLGDDAVGARREGASGPRATMVTASVVLPGGAPHHGDLAPARRWMKAAFAAEAATAPPVRGVGDLTRLLPEALTVRVAERAALAFDACATNPGALPASVACLGDHRPRAVAALGFPIGLDLIAALSRTPEQVSVAVVADAGRIGGADVHAWLGDELAAWGLPDRRW